MADGDSAGASSSFADGNDINEPVISITSSKLNDLVDSRCREWQSNFLTTNGISEKTDAGQNNINENKNFINHVAFKSPQPLFAQNPSIWFKILEHQFNVSNIKVESTKYSHAVGALDSRLHNQFAELILKNNGDKPYTVFKEEVIRVLGESEKVKLNNMLHKLSLGDKKPSQLLSEFRLNAGNEFTEKTIQQLWMQRLPQQVQMILTPFENVVSLAILSERADNLVETMSQSQICTVDSASSSLSATSKLFTKDSESHSLQNSSHFERLIIEQISDLKSQINKLNNSNPRSRQRSRSNSRNPNRSYSKERLDPKYEICWYHYKFNNKALKCIPGCKLFEQFTESKKQSNSKNMQ